MENKFKKRVYNEANIQIVLLDSADILVGSGDKDNDGEYPEIWWMQ